MISRTAPCRIVVLPVLSDNIITNNEVRNKTVDPELIPKERGRPVYNETIETAGMVKPMLASADPRDRFKLFCS